MPVAHLDPDVELHHPRRDVHVAHLLRQQEPTVLTAPIFGSSVDPGFTDQERAIRDSINIRRGVEKS